MKDVNLKAMTTLASAFPEIDIGYSDHTLGFEISIAAVALGASIIEKHFTLDKTSEGPDHRTSLIPEELTEMVQAIRNIEKAMGDGRKKISPSEIKNIPIARKSITAARKIFQGELLTEDNLTVKRPGTGISPTQWDYIIGKKSPRNFSKDELIEL